MLRGTGANISDATPLILWRQYAFAIIKMLSMSASSHTRWPTLGMDYLQMDFYGGLCALFSLGVKVSWIATLFICI